LNDGLQIVGFDRNAAGPQGFKLAGTSLATFDAPGAIETVAFKINNNGKIAGSYEDGGGTFHGFVATP
jgi:hypothetical protein